MSATKRATTTKAPSAIATAQVVQLHTKTGEPPTHRNPAGETVPASSDTLASLPFVESKRDVSVNLNKPSKERIGVMADKTKAPGSEIFDQALKNYEQTLRTGLQLQEEAGRWWTNLVNQATSTHDWQKKVTGLADELIAPSQKRMQEYLGFLEQSNQANVELLKKALEAAQSSAPSESQAKWVDFWEASLKSLQSNAQAVTQINTKMMESWVAFVKKNTAEFAEPAVFKA